MQKFSATIALCLSLALSAPAAIADDLTDTAQDIIYKQITAFLNDDAETAYSFASQSIRGKFPNQTMFFDMVRRSYAPIYRPGNFAFGRAKVTEEAVVQEVLISGPDGRGWTALYQVVKQPDGDYKINGVHIVKSAPGPAI